MAKILHIDDLKPEMILAEPVTNNFGQTLLPAGMQLLERHITLLRTWGIMSVVLKSEENEVENEISEEIRTLSTLRVRSRMRWEPQTEIEKNIFDLGVHHAALKFIRDSKGNPA